VVSYGTGVLVGVVLGALTFLAWLVGYLVWDGFQRADFVKSLIAAAVFMTVWLILLVRLKRE
jgi:peptidoglycan biosynthesis protein MviN/MurJ (putative lipid II flippase)